MAKNLVVVESPAKAKTINKYLGKDFTVTASMGHVRDLPKNPKKKGKKILGGVDVGRGFAVDYEVLPTRRKIMEEIKSAAQKADAIYLAADPDREGEAICWHLAEELGPEGQEEAAAGGLQRDHQEGRRGGLRATACRGREEGRCPAGAAHPRPAGRLQVTPMLWDKVRRGLSAGRVQSVALRLICEREREIRAFVAEEYWTVAAQLAAGQPPAFVATLAKKDGRNLEITNGEQAAEARRDLEPARYVVTKVTARERRRNPVPPFITSTLQQEAFKKLRFSVKKTMQVAQRLYEGVELGDEGSVGPDHLHAHGLDPRLGRGARGRARPHRPALRRRVPAGEAQRLPRQEGRPGRPRGHPPDLLRARPRVGQALALQGRARTSIA